MSEKERREPKVAERLTGSQKPEWLGSREGISDEVLPPWIPIKVERKGPKEESPTFSVSCWGRTYEFATLPFPHNVVTKSCSILSDSIRLIVRVDGRLQRWQGGSIELREQTPARVSFSQRITSSALTLSADTKIEYDGLIRIDWKVEPRRPLRLEEITVEIPLHLRYARYFYYFPWRSRTTRNAGTLPSEGLIFDFLPFIWLGDEDLGLAWFSESDKNWFNAQPDRVTEIVRKRENVVLRLHLVSTPIEMAPGGKMTDGVQMPDPEQGPLGDLSYTLGLQATPVKPVTKDVWEYRICHAGNYGIETLPADALSTLIYSAEGNINLDRGTLEFWIKPLFDPLQLKADQTLFIIQLSGDNQMRCYWRAKDRKLWLSLRQAQKTFLKLNAQPRWSRDKFHHFVLTWGDAICIYSDGTLIAKQPHKGALPGGLTGGNIIFGGLGSYFVIDEIRVSDIARTDKEICFAAAGNIPALDDHTLLLDHLDESFEPGVIQHLDGGIPKGIPATRPAKVSGAGGIIPIHPPGTAMFTAGKLGTGLQLGMDKPVLDYLADLGVRTICFHEHWTEIEGYTSTTRNEELHSLVKACHERGIQLLLYFGFMISDIAPEWPHYRDEVLTAKDARGSDLDIAPQPRQKYYSVCYRSVWQDFLAYGIARLMDEFDIDGVYLDGTGYPQRCVNNQHGCSYIRPDGSVAPSYSIWATREMMRRIYTIVKSRKPDGQVNFHNSTCMTIPTLAWATSTWDGEQFPGYRLGQGMFALDILPLDAFRTEFMGHQWGVPAEFLCYERPITYSEACAITLPHDVLVRGNGLGPNLEFESKLWRLGDEFGRKEADWLPYWKNSEYVTVRPDEAKVSLYRHSTNGILAVVSNLTRDQANVEMLVSLQKLRISSDVTAQDALTEEALPFENGKLSLTQPSMGWNLVWIKPMKKGKQRLIHQ